MGRNGYFQFRNTADRLELVLYPSESGDRNALIEKLLHCLDMKRIEVADIGTVGKTIKSSTGKTVIDLGKAVPPFGDWCEYDLQPDRMKAIAVHYPGFEGFTGIDENEVRNNLEFNKVVYGIKDEAVKSLLKVENYLEPVVIAEGLAPVLGHDGVLTYCFDVDKKAKPSIREDGTVDYRDIDGLNHICAGDVVARIIPVDHGKPGIDIYGKDIIPPRMKKVNFRYGRNMHISEDGLELISDVNGHVTLEEGKVFVSNILQLVDVDSSTGNVEYNGDVFISGNVYAGFSVKATGNIEIRGIVEGAYIESGGDITLVRGIQGMNRAQIVCGGNMVTKFIEGASSITVTGNLDTDTILHSKVSVNGYIKVAGKNGLIVGGDVRSVQGISAKTIGNEMGTATVVGAGVDPSTRKKMEQLKKDIVAANENKSKMEQIITVLRARQKQLGTLEPDKLEMLQKTTRNLVMADVKLKDMRAEFDELNSSVVENENARIKVYKMIHTGTKLVFGNVYMFLKGDVSYCQFAKLEGEVKILQM